MKRLLAFLSLLLALAAAAPGASAQPFSPDQRAELEKIIREVLTRDPSILREALAKLEAAESHAQATAARAALAANADLLVANPADPTLGNPEGDVTIVEFSDYRCPYCRRAHPEVRRLLAEDRRLRLVAKELPILGPGSVVMARVALAAHRQGRWEAVNARLITFQGEPTEAAVVGTALSVGGIDEARLRRDMGDPAIAAQLQANLQLARAIGVSGTPAFVIGGRLIPGAIDLAELRRLVAEARGGGR
ncbi:MAG: thioredoxin domain-containing protein [Acetobacteraceae bacterium]|nr:thioredoxin domain-containing protein [Acetobacteraceae bacterium]